MSPEFDFGHSPWFFPVHVHWHLCKFPPTPDNVRALAYGVWNELGGWDSWVRVTTGRPLPCPWGWMGHVWLGEDLRWRPREGGRPVAGTVGGDLRYRPRVQDWVIGCWVDDRYTPTVEVLSKAVAHEIEHLLGRLPSHPPFPPDQLRAGAVAAAKNTRGEHVPLPDREPIAEETNAG